MDDLTVEEIISSNCKGDISIEDVKLRLDGIRITPDIYNKVIIRILRNNYIRNDHLNTNYGKTLILDQLLDESFIREIFHTKAIEQQDPFRNKYSAHNNTIDFFFEIKNCPSYLQYQEVLNREDLKLFMKIYCEMNGLSLAIDEEVVDFVENMMKEVLDDLMKEN